MQRPVDELPGTQELEKGMTPGRATDVLRIGVIAILMLLVCNAGGLARWTQTLPSNAAYAWIAEVAGGWEQTMRRLGPAELFERLRERFKIE